LQVEVTGLQFDFLEVYISPANPSIADIVPARCAELIIKHDLYRILGQHHGVEVCNVGAQQLHTHRQYLDVEVTVT